MIARVGVVLLLSCALMGCATLPAALDDDAPLAADDEARLAALPRVPAHHQILSFPPALRGITFRVDARVDGAIASDAETMRIERACVTNFEHWMSDAGWVPVPDPQATVDLIIEEHCTSRVSTSRYGNLLEIRHPESETLAIVVEHDGAPLMAVPRGPADYVCESNGTPKQMLNDCMERAERWAQEHILESLIASEPLARFLQTTATRGTSCNTR